MKKALVLSWIPAVLALGLSVVFWGQAPEQFPIHWNIHGQADRFASKTLGLLLFPGIIAFLPLLLLGLLKVDPRKENVEESRRAITLLVVGLAFFMLGMHGLTIKAALSPNQSLSTSLITLLLGGLFAGIGAVIARFKSNFFVGIRTPWTLDNEEVWARTHKLASVTMIAGGVVAAVSGFVLPGAWALGVSIGVIAVGALVPAVASFFFFQTQQKTS